MTCITPSKLNDTLCICTTVKYDLYNFITRIILFDLYLTIANVGSAGYEIHERLSIIPSSYSKDTWSST